MGFSLSKGSLICLIAAATWQACSAFVQSNRAFGTTNRPALVGQSFAGISPADKNTALSMVIEQFIADSDEKQRNADNAKYLAEIQKRVDRINALEPTIEDLGDDELQAKTEEFKQRLAKGEDINGPLLEEAFAVVREAAWYVLHLHLHHSFPDNTNLTLFSCPGVSWNCVITMFSLWVV